MGIYLNPGYKSFEEAVNSEIYVDKTEMICYTSSVLQTKQKYVSVSRPRRFGKTMAADMLCAYYGKVDSRFLFEERKLAYTADWDRYLNSFDVIRIVMTKFFKRKVTVDKALAKLQSDVIREIKNAYPNVEYINDKDIIQTMEDVYSSTNGQFVIIIDEWDAVFRERKEDKDGQTEYLDFLRDWLKDQDYIALAYMTGILPIKKYGKHSALNMFMEHSIITPMQLAPYAGFTETEVRELALKYNMRYEDISDWYDGYIVTKDIPVYLREKYRQGEYDENRMSIYSPLSVVSAISTGLIQNYWNKTESYEALADYIKMNQDGLKDAVMLMMDGARVKVDISSYQNDMTTFHNRDDVIALLIHLGYLGYDTYTKEVFIPNKEIMDEFRTSTKSDEWAGAFEDFRTSQLLLQAVWGMDESRTAELLERAHDRVDNKRYHDEAALSYAVQYAFYAAQKYYTTIQELDTGKGYADLVYLPAPRYSDKPALLIELKYGRNAEEAINQIKHKNYLDKMGHYRGNVLLVGINYDGTVSDKAPGYKRHSCKIEKL